MCVSNALWWVSAVDVAFLAVKLNLLFFINRLTDIVFMADIYINFKLAYFSKHERRWIVQKKAIQQHYLRSWFCLDVVSTLPYDIIDIIVDYTASGDGPSPIENLKVLRVLKILKLFKLLRLLKSARVIR